MAQDKSVTKGRTEDFSAQATQHHLTRKPSSLPLVQKRMSKKNRTEKADSITDRMWDPFLTTQFPQKVLSQKSGQKKREPNEANMAGKKSVEMSAREEELE
jgi:hypothetical protein